jgi:prepilin-type N-terminal cleavage/methylation domain-containing protein
VDAQRSIGRHAPHEPSEGYPGRGERRGVSVVELVIVLVILGVISSLALPRLNLGRFRSDAAASQVRSVLQTAQRTSLTRQYDVIVSMDTVKGGLRIAEDVNNNGAIEVSEWKFWRPLGEGNRFAVPPKGITNSVTTSVVGSALKKVDNMPSIIFHRDGSASTDAEVYVASTSRGRTDYRAVALTRSTGRAELYRLSGTGTGASWLVASQ